jgi:hypothetical protein
VVQLIWDTDLVISDIEATTYLQKLGQELTTYSENPRKHFGFLFYDKAHPPTQIQNLSSAASLCGYRYNHTGQQRH